MWQTYLQPTTLEEALALVQQYAGQARIVAGGTDLIVELQRGIRPTATVIDISRLRDLKYVRAADGWLHLGARATHNDVLASPEAAAGVLPLAGEERVVPLDQFYLGVRRTVLAPDELLREIRFPLLTANQRGLWRR